MQHANFEPSDPTNFTPLEVPIAPKVWALTNPPGNSLYPGRDAARSRALQQGMSRPIASERHFFQGLIHCMYMIYIHTIYIYTYYIFLLAFARLGASFEEFEQHVCKVTRTWLIVFLQLNQILLVMEPYSEGQVWIMPKKPGSEICDNKRWCFWRGLWRFVSFWNGLK